MGASAPAGAQIAPVQECEIPEGMPVLREGITETTLPQPFGFETGESVEWVLDLGDVPAGTTATLAVHEEWQILANDWELEVTTGAASGESSRWQPVQSAEENVTLQKVKHCVTVVVTSVNHQSVATGDLDPLNTTLTVSNIKIPAA